MKMLMGIRLLYVFIIALSVGVSMTSASHNSRILRLNYEKLISRADITGY